MVLVQRKVLIAAVIVLGLVVVGSILWWLWGVLDAYIDPKEPTEKKELVNIFVFIAAGVIGSFTAIAAVGNLYISRMNLQTARDTLHQQRELDEHHAQDDALQAYYDYLFPTLADLEARPVRIDESQSDQDQVEVAPSNPVTFVMLRVRTLALLSRLRPDRKIDVLKVLYESGVIYKDNAAEPAAVSLYDADLGGIAMSEGNWERIDL